MGVSTAGEVDARTGVIRLSDKIPGYTGLNPRQILEGELGLPVAVENDCLLYTSSAAFRPDFVRLLYSPVIVSNTSLYSTGRLLFRFKK